MNILRVFGARPALEDWMKHRFMLAPGAAVHSGDMEVHLGAGVRMRGVVVDSAESGQRLLGTELSMVEFDESFWRVPAETREEVIHMLRCRLRERM